MEHTRIRFNSYSLFALLGCLAIGSSASVLAAGSEPEFAESLSSPIVADLIAPEQPAEPQSVWEQEYDLGESIEPTTHLVEELESVDSALYDDVTFEGGYCQCSGDQCRSRGCFTCSDHCFDSFISPMTNLVFFEDPRTLTEARLIFLQHKVPAAALGGDIQLMALHIRAAINQRLSIIATKDGHVWSSNPLIRDGWADINIGLKYNLIRDVYNQRLLSTGVTYEMPTGSSRTRQGNGDGVFHVFMTGGAQICRCGHWISAFGFRLPTNTFEESQSCYWSNHFDYQFRRGWYAVAECNWYHWTKSGGNGIPGIEGGDLFNFGSTGVAGNDIVTGAIGLKYKPNGHREYGIAWEAPLTERRDVLENRLTVDCIFRY